MKSWTETHIKDLKEHGKIRDYKLMGPKKLTPNGKIVAKAFKKKSKEKEWIEWNLMYLCNKYSIQLQEEYKFHPERKWRYDYAAPSLKIAWEWEGIMSEHSRHTNIVGYSKDSTKYNEGQKLGWIILRFTVLNKNEMLKISETTIIERLKRIKI